MNLPSPGELYWAYFESGEPRPIIVVSQRELNSGKYVVVVPLTSTNLDKRWSLRNCVSFNAGSFGLSVNCVAQCEAITFIEKECIILNSGPIGKQGKRSAELKDKD